VDVGAVAEVEADRLHDPERGAGVKTSAAARTPVYFSMTGAAAAAVVASSRPRTAAETFSPCFVRRPASVLEADPDTLALNAKAAPPAT
jgi:hypothetical protein